MSLSTLLMCALSLLVPHEAAAGTRQAHRPVVVIDPGHGGPDIGATDPTGTMTEKSLTLAVAKRAASDLSRMGYTVYLTRTRDQAVNTPPRDLNQDKSIDHVDELDARTLFANHHHADVFFSIHFDASGDPSIHGTHGYYCPARPFWRKSLRLATLLTNAVSRSLQRAGYAAPNSGVQTDVADVVPQTRKDYPWFLVLGPSLRHFVTGTGMPGALIESLYLTSPKDASALRHTAIINAIAQGYVDGVRAYLGTGAGR